MKSHRGEDRVREMENREAETQGKGYSGHRGRRETKPQSIELGRQSHPKFLFRHCWRP